MSEDDARELELQRWGTRFANELTRRAFREWQFARTTPQRHALMALTTFIWVTLPLTLVASGSFAPVEYLWLGPFIYPPVALGIYATWARSAVWWRRYVLVGMPTWSIAAVWGAAEHQDVDLGGMVLITGTAGALIVAASMEGALDSLPCGLMLTSGAQVLRTRLHLSGGLSLAGLEYETLMLWSFLALGSLVATSADRAAHSAYRQERIIEAQKRTIARERARSEELLQRELSHQVAERSRALGAVLARSDVSLDVRRLVPGERFAERYRIVSPLGAGGMGAVYEVERVTDSARLALKAVVGEVSGGNAARFAREAEIGARIRHPHLIPIVDVGISDGVPFLVMELVGGGSLEGQRTRFGDVPWALRILRDVAAGLAALHDAGVVHRDLKPANVLLDGSTAKISDFGISRFGALEDASIDPSADTMASSPRPGALDLTGTGMVMGTPLYMAPEGARSARALDASADVFALGIIAYEMLVGRAPFPVPAFVLAMAHQPVPTPAPIDDLRAPAPLRALIVKCLDGDPSKRPRVSAMAEALAG